jgi:hypothetical protein
MSSMMDLAAALGGGPGAAAGPPPGLAGPPPDAGAGPEEPDQFQTSLDALDAAEQALHAFIQLDPDEGDRAIAAQCLQNVIKLKAANQQSNQQGDMKSLARALQAGGAGGPLG